MIYVNVTCKCNNDKCQCQCKKHLTFKKHCCWNPSTCICENSKYLKRIADDSVFVGDEIVSVMDIVSKNVTKTVPTNITNNTSANVASTV